MLNNYILANILDLLDDVDWMNFRLTCKRIYYLPTFSDMNRRLMKYIFQSRCKECHRCLTCVTKPMFTSGYCWDCTKDYCYHCVKAHYGSALCACYKCGKVYCSKHNHMKFYRGCHHRICLSCDPISIGDLCDICG